MAPPELSDQQQHQTRTSAAEIHAAIERLLAGEAFLANRPWSEIWWGLMHLDLFSGWRIAIWIKRHALDVCQSATAAANIETDSARRSRRSTMPRKLVCTSSPDR